jgi:hypothetical protein
MREFTGDALFDRCMEAILSYDPLAILQRYKQTAARLREEYVSALSSALAQCARGTRAVERTPVGVRNLAVTCFLALMDKNPRCRMLQEEAEFEKDAHPVRREAAKGESGAAAAEPATSRSGTVTQR